MIEVKFEDNFDEVIAKMEKARWCRICRADP